MKKNRAPKPRFEFTQEGFDNMHSELAELRVKRVEAVAQLRKARDMGDLSENSAYKVSRQKLNAIDGRQTRLTVLLKYAVIIQPGPKDIVGLSSKVKVNDGQMDREFTIVGGYESDLAQGKISSFSPIGKALLGSKAGDLIEIIIPAGKILYTVLKVF